MSASVTHRLVKGTAWLSLARLFVNALSVLSTFVLARLLAPSDFGLVALGTTMMMVLTDVTELSLAQALVRHADPTRAHFDTAWTLNALRGSLLGTLFALASAPAARLYGDERLTGIMLALGASIFLSGLTNPRRVLLTRQLIFRQEFVLNVGQKLAGVLASVLVAWLTQSYWALVVGILATQATNVALSYLVLPYLPRPRLAHARELFSFSVWLSAVQLVNTLNWRFDALFVGKFLGSTALGHYTMGSTLASIPTRETTSPLRQTFFPAFASMREDMPRLSAAYQRAQAVVTAVALPAGVGAALVADPLVRLAMGEKWVPAIAIVQALAAVYALQTLGSSADALGMALGRTRLLFVRSLQMLLLRIPLIVAAMLLYGLPGLIAARVCTGLVATAVNMLVVRQLIGLGLRAQLQANRRALLASCAMVAAALAAALPFAPSTEPRQLALQAAAMGAAAALGYFGATALLWHGARRPPGPEQELQRLLQQLRGKLRARPA
ncbi:MAG TPA: lipopolysaccharide biosynthesis protein [Pseudorhodoferax sp.]|nr:lipopolysaccharide biosynthesis protein [Pseudorhodoferax sp.]